VSSSDQNKSARGLTFSSGDAEHSSFLVVMGFYAVPFVRYTPVCVVISDSGFLCGVNQFFVLPGFFSA
jgi:hypothetical protein